MGLLGGGGVPGQLAISQQLKPAHLPGLEHGLGLLPVLQPSLSQSCHKLTLHLHPSHIWCQWEGVRGDGAWERGKGRARASASFAFTILPVTSTWVCKLYDKAWTIVLAHVFIVVSRCGACVQNTAATPHPCHCKSAFTTITVVSSCWHVCAMSAYFCSSVKSCMQAAHASVLQ